MAITETVLLMQPSTLSGRKWRHSVCRSCCVTVSSPFGYSLLFYVAEVAEWLRDFCARWLIHREGITMFMSELTTLIEPFIVAITILLGAFTIAGCMQKEQ